jgi:hypothetical protein
MVLDYAYIDVDDPGNELYCDQHDVNELPHLEAYFTKIDKVFYKPYWIHQSITIFRKSHEQKR